MKVKELEAILSKCDPEMEIGTFANNHIHFSSAGNPTRVALWNRLNAQKQLFQTCLIIGNFDRNISGDCYNWIGDYMHD